MAFGFNTLSEEETVPACSPEEYGYWLKLNGH